MENRGLKIFAIAFGIAVFIVLMLGVSRLFRFALIAFGISGFVLLIWGAILARNDDELEDKPKEKKLPKASTPFLKKLFSQIAAAREESDNRRQAIDKLEEKTAYFIRNIYGEVYTLPEKDQDVFLQYETIKKKASSMVSNSLVSNCDKVVFRHRNEMNLLNAELHYWQTLEQKYTFHYEKMAEQLQESKQIDSTLRKKEKRKKKEAALNNEMEEYLEKEPLTGTSGLEDAIYENEKYVDITHELREKLAELESKLQCQMDAVEYLDDIMQSYHAIKNEADTIPGAVGNKLADDIRNLGNQLNEL